MMKFATSLGLLALPILPSASAIPHIPRDLPSGTTRLAIDEVTGQLLAYDETGVELGVVPPAESDVATKRQVGTCSALSADDAQKLPGWEALKSMAQDNWGSGSWNIVTNPEEYKNYPANICVSPDQVQITQSQEPQCRTSTQSTEGKNVGTSGTVSLAWTQGTSFATTTTVTQEASVAQGITVGVSVSIPAVADISLSTTTTVTFSNTQSSAAQTTTSNQQTQTVTINSAEGQTCKLDVESTACDIIGTGEVEYIASGWVWFNYEDKTQGHYKWALNLENLSEADRSSYMKFSTTISANTNSKYSSHCS